MRGANRLDVLVANLMNASRDVGRAQEKKVDSSRAINREDGALREIKAEAGSGLRRYEIVRKLNARQFADLYQKSIKTGVPFDQLVDELAAPPINRLQLPPGESAFMTSMFDALDGECPRAGMTISFSFNETRQARGIEKKGLASVSVCGAGSGGDVTLTELGAAWMLTIGSLAKKDIA